MESTLTFVKKNCELIIPISDISMVISLCKVLETLLENITNQFASSSNLIKIDTLFIYALIWAIGGSLGQDYQKILSNYIRNFAEEKNIKFPAKGTIFDYFIDNTNKENLKFEEWSSKINKQLDFDASTMRVNSIVIPIKENLAISSLAKNLTLLKHSVLLIGNTGCGKTELSKNIIKEIASDFPNEFTYQIINLNYYTDSSFLQKILTKNLEIKKNCFYGPKGNKSNLIYFLDDLNLPQLDHYNTQSHISLLRQILEYKNYYDISLNQTNQIENIQQFASMNPYKGSFVINPRFQRHFCIVNVPFPENESLFIFFSTFLNGHLKKFDPIIKEEISSSSLINASINLHVRLSEIFKKTAKNFHYEFNLRQISRIIEGILLSNSKDFPKPDKLIRLWINESERVYRDNLITLNDIEKFNSEILLIIKNNFPNNLITQEKSLQFCTFPDGFKGKRYYNEVQKENLKSIIEEFLIEYNKANSGELLKVFLFDEALNHICRISRIISLGHALLIGVKGSGKQSIAKLAAFIHNMSIFSIDNIDSENDLKNELRNLCERTGVNQKKCLFLLNEQQIMNDKFPL